MKRREAEGEVARYITLDHREMTIAGSLGIAGSLATHPLFARHRALCFGGSLSRSRCLEAKPQAAAASPAAAV